MYQKKHQTIPRMKVLYGLFLTTNDVENYKIERVKSWTQDMDPGTRPQSTSDVLILEHLGMTCK